MAAASGLPLVPRACRTRLSHNSGIGELIRALDMGCRKFIIGIGGSATMWGAGMGGRRSA